MAILYVFLGGGIGSCLRYGVHHFLDRYSLNFPIATIAANALACLLFGFAMGYIIKENLPDQYRLLLLTGICGGFSTFSTFTNDSFKLIGEGQLLYVFGNIVLSVVVCLVFLSLGYKWSGQ
ncbi:MAG: fluoride efflux transporter CrcB [Bacteroidia bacterium]|nr:fluoride efflux transporter CrcB [Bacteroidia bacterium]